MCVVSHGYGGLGWEWDGGGGSYACLDKAIRVGPFWDMPEHSSIVR